MTNTGKFVISLDFELMWGVRDKKTIEQYGGNILGVHQVIPKLLNIFNKYEIKATFATVGFLFFESRDELLKNIPENIPNYFDQNLSPYGDYIINLEDVSEGKYHFAPNLIKLIKENGKQEIASHTFSHYYCLEKGQDVLSFKSDLESAIKTAKLFGVEIRSLVFPRNQFNEEYLKVCYELGIICYRGNEKSWIYEAKNGSDETWYRRMFRLIDAYINISGHNCYPDEYFKNKDIIDVPSSRFLRPFSSKLSLLDTLRLRRIKSGMTYAAINNQTYHLWWHPHNFGANQEENFLFLDLILNHYKVLNKQYGFKSVTMIELAEFIKSNYE
jgi:hypothetical protein